MSEFGNNIQARKITLLKKAYEFYAKKLNLENISNLNIDIDVNNNMLKPHQAGACITQYLKSTEQLLKINVYIKESGSPIGMADTLAHEMVHVWQHANGHFKHEDVKDFRIKMFGLKLFPYIRRECLYKGIDESKSEYFDLKYEQEAFSYGAILLRLFLEEHRDDILLTPEEALSPLNLELEEIVTKTESIIS